MDLAGVFGVAGVTGVSGLDGVEDADLWWLAVSVTVDAATAGVACATGVVPGNANSVGADTLLVHAGAAMFVVIVAPSRLASCCRGAAYADISNTVLADPADVSRAVAEPSDQPLVWTGGDVLASCSGVKLPSIPSGNTSLIASPSKSLFPARLAQCFLLSSEDRATMSLSVMTYGAGLLTRNSGESTFPVCSSVSLWRW